MKPAVIQASGFNIRSIGGVETGGKPINKWWYTGTAPALRGEAPPMAEVTVTIDGTQRLINADSSGEWAFQTDSLASGEHQIGVESGGSKLEFTLVIGTENVDWDEVAKGGEESLPTVGVAWPSIILPGIGGGMMWWSKKRLWQKE